MNNCLLSVCFHSVNERDKVEYSLFNFFHIIFYVKKIKIDYSMFPVKQIYENKKNISFCSEVSQEKFTFKKKGKYIEDFKKTKTSLSYSIVLKTEKENMEKNEIEMLPILEKRIRAKIPFRFLYKKKLRDRIKRIINPSCP